MALERETGQTQAERGLASRCLLALTTLRDQGPLTLHDVVDAMAERLEADAASADGLLFDDLRTAEVVGWIEPLPGNSRRFRLTASGGEVVRRATGSAM
jgi:hypothetical protein